MTDQNKPREFWIHKNGSGTADPDYQSQKPNDSFIDEFFHVIEYSEVMKVRGHNATIWAELESLRKKNERLREALEQIAECETVVSPDGSRFPIGAFAREALKAFDEGGE